MVFAICDIKDWDLPCIDVVPVEAGTGMNCINGSVSLLELGCGRVFLNIPVDVQ
jgi:hypothetical protein